MKHRIIRVLVADDDRSAREALADLVAGEPDMDLTGDAEDADESVRLARDTQPDVVVLDVRMPGGGGPAAARAIRLLRPTPAIIAFSAYDDRASVLEMIQAGAVGYVVKGAPVLEVLDTIRRAAAGLQPPQHDPPVVAAPRPSADAAPARVLIADDDPLVREALADLVDGAPELELAGVAADADEAVRLACMHRPDVAVVDVRMPKGGGSYVAREITAGSPGTKVIVLSVWRDRDTVLEMLRAGAVSYLVKGMSSVEEILATIRRAAAGQAVLSAEVTSDVVDELLRLSDRNALDLERRRRIADVLRSGVSTVLQPIADLHTTRVVGVEALARFPPPARNPAAWFRDAAAVGLGEQLEHAALQSAIEHIDGLPSRLWLSVNLSPRSLASPDVVAALRDAAPGRLVVEVAGHASVDDYDVLRDALDDLVSFGVRVAVDDVGAGSALRHVLELSPTIVKLDISLVRGIDTDEKRRMIASTIVSLSALAGMEVVAEGIETPDELACLRALGVRFGQGFHLARPGAGPVPESIAALAS